MSPCIHCIYVFIGADPRGCCWYRCCGLVVLFRFFFSSLRIGSRSRTCARCWCRRRTRSQSSSRTPSPVRFVCFFRLYLLGCPWEGIPPDEVARGPGSFEPLFSKTLSPSFARTRLFHLQINKTKQKTSNSRPAAFVCVGGQWQGRFFFDTEQGRFVSFR